MRNIATIWKHPAIGGLLLAFGVGACAHAPNANLVQAEQEFRAAETDPVVVVHAPLLLEDARKAVQRGEQAYRDGEEKEEVDHLAYLASRRVEIARLSAQRRADVERAEELSHERGPLVVVTPVPQQATRLQAPRHDVVEDVFFEAERSAIPEASRVELGRAAAEITAHPDRWVRVEGHADDTERQALVLSQKRAARVARELVALGVDPDRVTIRGLGAEVPLASLDTAAARQRNRRVEILLIPDSSGDVGAR